MNKEFLTKEYKPTNFIMVPREIFAQDINPISKVIYAKFLDRAMASKKNRWYEDNIIYFAFPIPKIAKECHVSTKTVQRALDELEANGWITRQRSTLGRANKYQIRIPVPPKATCTESKITGATILDY